MTIFLTDEELHEVVGSGAASNTLEAFVADIDSAVAEYIIPIFGDGVIEFLSGRIEAETEDVLEKKAIKCLQRAAGNLAYLSRAQEGGVLVDDAGMHRVDNTSTKSAYQWQVSDFKKAREKNGWNAIRDLYTLLEKNLEAAWIVEHWLDCAEREVFLVLFVKTDLEFSKFISIGGMQTFWELLNHITEVQDSALLPLLTEGVYDRLLSNDELNAQEKKALKLAKKVVCTGTIFRAIPLLPFKIQKAGLIISEFVSNKDNATQQTQATQQIKQLQSSAQGMFAEAKEQLDRYLRDNASTELFATFYTEKVLPEIESETTYQDLMEKNKTSKIVRF